MKKLFLIPLVIIVVLVVLLFNSCYYINSDNIVDYEKFMLEINDKKPEIYKFLPNLQNTDYIEDIYLYYSDYDLLDSMFTVYVNCVYDDETYISECNRLEFDYNKFRSVASYAYDSMVVTEFCHISHLTGDDFANLTYMYALRNEDDNRIVYVMFFQKGDMDIITDNIPNQYLPKEFFEKDIS